jgi:hypothetical protein
LADYHESESQYAVDAAQALRIFDIACFEGFTLYVFVPRWLKNDSTPTPTRKSVAPHHFRPRKTVSHSYSKGCVHSEFTKGVLARVAVGLVSSQPSISGEKGLT